MKRELKKRDIVNDRRPFEGRRFTVLKKGYEVSSIHDGVHAQCIVTYNGEAHVFQSTNWIGVSATDVWLSESLYGFYLY